MDNTLRIEFFTLKKMLIFFVSLVVVLCIILVILHYRGIIKEVQFAQLSNASPYAKIISNSSNIENKKYPVHHFLSDGSIEKVKFLEPSDLKNNTETVIIVLGDRPLDDTTPTVDMIYRVLKGVELAKKFPKAIMIMSGGATKGPIPEAKMMGLIAWGRGVDPQRIILEDKSQTTVENAKNTADIVGAKNIRKVFVISERSRLEDAVAIFQKHEKEFKNIQGVPSDVTSVAIIEQMEQFLMTHDDRVVRGRLHYAKIGREYKAFKFAVLPEGTIPLLSDEVSRQVAYQKYFIDQDNKFNEINYLLDLIENSSFSFERNGRKGSSKDAAKLLKFKLHQYRDQIHTTEDFIEKVASFSSHTKQNYYVINTEGKKFLLRGVLYTELNKLRSQSKE